MMTVKMIALGYLDNRSQKSDGDCYGLLIVVGLVGHVEVRAAEDDRVAK